MSSWLQKQRTERPEQPAFYWQDSVWTFAEVEQEVQRWMTEFAAKIPTTEQRIALFSRNSKELYFSILALWELGKELVLLNTQLSVAELTYQLDDAAVQYLVCAPTLRANFLSMKELHVIPMICTAQAAPVKITKEPYQTDAVASIMYTSGTTGYPKGVLQCFENHEASALATQENMQVTANDCWLCSVPLFHISGLSIVIRQLVLGCSIRLYDRFDAQVVTKELSQGTGTILSVVAIMLQELLEHYPAKGYSAHFKGLLLGGGPIAMQTLERCQEQAIPIIQSYGMTETCSQVVALCFDEAARKIGSAGKPLKGMNLKIMDLHGQKLPVNQVGEVWLKGKNVVTAYLNESSEQSRKWTEDNWFKTGDMGYLDEEGYLYLVSRLSELIISGGENIYPTEIEQVIEQMPEVREVAVVGEPDERWGAVPVAYIVADTPVTKETVQAFVQPYLAKFKRPKQVYLCRTLPRTASGKLAKHQLTTNEREAFLRNEHS